MSDRPAWARALETSWWRPDTPHWPLRLLAACFGAVATSRRLAYRRGWLRSHRLDVPVLVIGNRIVGGAGKTPVALAVLDALRRAGWHPGLVSRGYGASSRHPRAVSPASRANEVGDEPLLIARQAGVPVWVGRDRVAAAQGLRSAHPEVDVVICDDGLQHLRLARDLALVVFDERGGGNGWLLPAGPLREPLDAPSGAAREWVVYNAAVPSTPLPGVQAMRSLAGIQLLADWWRSPGAALHPVEHLATVEAGVWAAAGIGSPQRFFDDLAAHGVQCHGVPLADHDDYRTLPWPPGVPHIVVTEKDAAKLDPARVGRERPGTAVWVAPMRLTLPASLLDELLLALQAVRGSMSAWTPD